MGEGFSKDKLAWFLFSYQHRRVWLDIFITTLPYSSAAGNRLFSTAWNVLGAKSPSLNEDNFEELVFHKRKMDLLEKMSQEGRKNKEEENDL